MLKKINKFARRLRAALAQLTIDFTRAMTTKNSLPVIGDFFPMPVPHVAVQQVEAHVGQGAFHPLHKNLALIYVEVIRNKISGLGWALPMKLVRYFRPERFGIFEGLFVHVLVFLEGRHAGFLDDIVGGLVDARHRDCVRGDAAR